MAGFPLWQPTWRWDSKLRIFKLREENYAPNLEPFTSEFNLSTELTWIHSPSPFFDLEIGGGWVAAETVAYNSSSPGHVAFRTGARTHIALVTLQRIYLSFNFDYFPFTFVDDWNWNIVVGWRFLN